MLEYQIFAEIFIIFKVYGVTKLFLNLYLAKILDLSAKSFFSCV